METNTVILDRGTYDAMQEQLQNLKLRLQSKVIYEKIDCLYGHTVYTDDEAVRKMAEKIKSLEKDNEELRLRLREEYHSKQRKSWFKRLFNK